MQIKNHVDNLKKLIDSIGVKKSTIAIVGIISLASLWMLTGVFKSHKAIIINAHSASVKIRVEESLAQPHAVNIVYNGVTEAIKIVSLLSEIDSSVEEIIAKDGQFLKSGAPILRLDEQASRDKVRQAQAAVNLQQVNFASVKALFNKKLSSESALFGAESNLKSAQAALVVAQQNLKHSYIVAPFDGYIDDIFVEQGSYLSPAGGTVIGKFIDISELKARIHIPHKDRELIVVGAPATITLRDKSFSGTVTFISKIASSNTKSFLAEVTFKNPDHTVFSGSMVKVNIQSLTDQKMHYIKKSSLSIEVSGNLVIKTLDDNGVVKNYSVSIIDEDLDGLWITGLPEYAKIITVGQAYVIDGEKVEVAS